MVYQEQAKPELEELRRRRRRRRRGVRPELAAAAVMTFLFRISLGWGVLPEERGIQAAICWGVRIRAGCLSGTFDLGRLSIPTAMDVVIYTKAMYSGS